MATPRVTGHARRDPEVQREGNDVTQAAFQSPYAHLADWGYERVIYTRDEANSVFGRNEGGAELPQVQRAELGRGRYPELSQEEMYKQGMFLQNDMNTIPTGEEHAGRGGQKDFDPNVEGLIVHADCYLVINGKDGHSIHASYFGDAERVVQHGAIVRGFRHLDEELPAQVRAARMILALPEAETIRYTPPATFVNIHGQRVDTEQALDAAARTYMDGEYITGGARREAVVTTLLTTRWLRVHEDVIGDAAWKAIYSTDHQGSGECRPDTRTLTKEQGDARRTVEYRRLVWHLGVPGLDVLLDAQEGRSVRQAGIAIQSKLTEHIRITDRQRRTRRVREYQRKGAGRGHEVTQLSDPSEYVTDDMYRGALDEKGMAYRPRIEAYQLIRTVILKDVWLIDHDHKEEEEDSAEEEVPDAACLTGARGQFAPPMAESNGRHPQPDHQSRGSGSGRSDAPMANGTGHGRTKTNEEGGLFGHSGETTESIMGHMNRYMHIRRDEERERIEKTGGPCDRESFLDDWSRERYTHSVAKSQDEFDRTFHSQEADSLVDDAIQPDQAMPLRDALTQTQALVEGVGRIAIELNAAGHYYKGHNSSETRSGISRYGACWHRTVDHLWYPPNAPQAAMLRGVLPTRPYEYLRREAISNLIIMQALCRPRHPRRVLTPGQGAGTEDWPWRSSPSDCAKTEPAEELARYYAACYVELPWRERYAALEMLTNWFGQHEAKWVADERARAGLTRKEAASPEIPRKKPGPREQEPQPQSQAAPPKMDIYHECSAEGCDQLVCNGGERQHISAPYCSSACWHKHAKDGRVHGPADTKAWAEDTTIALWGRGRLTEASVGPRRVAVLQMDIATGSPMSDLYHEQRREQEETCRAQRARAANATAKLTT